MSCEKISIIQKSLQANLSEKRYHHTIGVQYTAANLAMRYHYDIEKAQIAGLLHDCAKEYSDEKMLEKCKKYHLTINEVEKRNPYLLHCKLGAYLANTVYEIQDPEILNAITYHTTGRPEMSLLEKIIYVADYIEPGRSTFKELISIRSMAYIHLDKTIYLILKYTLEYLKKKKKQKEIDTMTIETYHYYEKWKGDVL